LPYREAVTHASNHAGYYPGSTQLTLKLLYDPETGKVWGARRSATTVSISVST
jgi:hypothetical protein